MATTATVSGGVHHGLAVLSNSEIQAAHSALARISTKSGNLGSHLGGSAQSATLFGGSFKGTGLSTASLAHGSGSDTFVGGARTASPLAIGSDTVVSGSAHAAGRSNAGVDVSGAHTVGNFALSSDTINSAGATATSVKAARPEENTKSHTVTLTDKTTVTITGLSSSHDVSKLAH